MKKSAVLNNFSERGCERRVRTGEEWPWLASLRD